MLKVERCTLILKCVEGRDAISYEELLSVIDTSSATLRRDVDFLCDNGQLRKIRGGVAPVAPMAAQPLQSYFFREHQLRNMAAKDAIARRAVELVGSPDTLILFGGSTVMRFAEYLPPGGLTILTDSLPVTNHMILKTRNRIFMTGGEVLAQQGVVLSPFGEEGPVQHIAASMFFIGCHAVGPAGIMEEDPLPLHGVRVLRKQAERLVVLADSSKFLASRSLVVCPLSEVDIFVTDDGLSDKAHKMLVDAGVTVIVAEVAGGNGKTETGRVELLSEAGKKKKSSNNGVENAQDPQEESKLLR